MVRCLGFGLLHGVIGDRLDSGDYLGVGDPAPWYWFVTIDGITIRFTIAMLILIVIPMMIGVVIAVLRHCTVPHSWSR
jgi:hypothetical protein